MQPDTTPAQAIEQLYHEYREPILRYLERLIGEREAAEDLTDETFLKAVRHWEQHDPAASAKSWLYRIARNTAATACSPRSWCAWVTTWSGTSSLAISTSTGCSEPTPMVKY